MLRVNSFALLLSFLPLLAAAQNSPQPAQQPLSSVPLVQLEDAFTREVPFVTADALTIPILCAADGTSFVQLARIDRQAASSGMGDIVAISKNGNEIVQFSYSKISDIRNPEPRNFATSDSGIYVLVRGSIPETKILTFKKPNGGAFQQQAASPVEYVARFKKDGSYLGAVQLDIPFEPIQIGVFPDGDFLIAGDDKSTFEPRIALVKSSGQFQRLLELPGDLHRSSDQPASADSTDKKSADPGALPQFGQTYNDSLYNALRFSMIIADERNLLLVRPGNKTPVFSVSRGGEVTPIALEIPDGFALADLKTGDSKWIGIYTRKREDGNGLQIETVIHDPVTGRVIARYAYPRLLGLAAACVNEHQISFLTMQDGKLIWNVLSIPR